MLRFSLFIYNSPHPHVVRLYIEAVIAKLFPVEGFLWLLSPPSRTKAPFNNYISSFHDSSCSFLSAVQEEKVPQVLDKLRLVFCVSSLCNYFKFVIFVFKILFILADSSD